MKAQILLSALVGHFILSGVSASSNTSCFCVAKDAAGTGQVNHPHPPELRRHLVGPVDPDDIEIWRFLEAHNFEVVSTRGIALGLGAIAARLGPSEIKRRMSAMIEATSTLDEEGGLKQTAGSQKEHRPTPTNDVTKPKHLTVSKSSEEAVSTSFAASQIAGPSGMSRAGQVATCDDLTMDVLSLSDELSDSNELSHSNELSDTDDQTKSEELDAPSREMLHFQRPGRAGQAAEISAWDLPEDYRRIAGSLRRRRFEPLSNAELKRIVPRYVQLRGVGIVRRCMDNIRLDLLAERDQTKNKQQTSTGESAANTRNYNLYLPHELSALERIIELEQTGSLSIFDRVRLESIVLKRHTEGSMKAHISRLKKAPKKSRQSKVEDVQHEIDESKE